MDIRTINWDECEPMISAELFGQKKRESSKSNETVHIKLFCNLYFFIFSNLLAQPTQQMLLWPVQGSAGPTIGTAQLNPIQVWCDFQAT